MKVYCSECRNFLEKDKKNECHAEGNKKLVESPIGKTETLELTPEEINKNNNCEWYIPRKPPAKKPEKKIAVGMPTILDHERRITALEAKKIKKK